MWAWREAYGRWVDGCLCVWVGRGLWEVGRRVTLCVGVERGLWEKGGWVSPHVGMGRGPQEMGRRVTLCVGMERPVGDWWTGCSVCGRGEACGRLLDRWLCVWAWGEACGRRMGWLALRVGVERGLWEVGGLVSLHVGVERGG